VIEPSTTNKQTNKQTNKREHKFRLNDLHDIAFGPKFYLLVGHLNHIYHFHPKEGWESYKIWILF
jgi:hypothetical protein